MQDILRYINSVEGVIGSAVFNDHGAVVDHAFPPIIDANALKTAAGLVLECTHGLQIAQTSISSIFATPKGASSSRPFREPCCVCCAPRTSICRC